MKKFYKSLFITAPETMIHNGNYIVVMHEDDEIERFPLKNLDAVSYFGNMPVRTEFMEACVKNDVRLNIFYPDGQFISSITGDSFKDSELKRQQYLASVNPDKCLEIARNTIMAKVFNSRWLIGRMYRDYGEKMDSKFMTRESAILKDILGEVFASRDMATLRDIKRRAAGELYSVMDYLIIEQKDSFVFEGRSTKTPVDPVNTMLSLSYKMLEEICVSALKSAGLDVYSGFFYMEKPNRMSLALDLLEEFKACIADRFVLTIINERQIKIGDFKEDDEGSYVLTDAGLTRFLSLWYEFINNKTIHPYLEENIEWGMLPYASVMLLVQFLRGEIDKYPPFLRQKVG